MHRLRRIAINSLFPLIVIAYATYSFWEHMTGRYASVVFTYGMLLIIPVFILALLAIGQVIYRDIAASAKTEEAALAQPDQKAEAPSQEDREEGARALKRPALLLALAFAFVLLLPVLGHWISFALLVIAAQLVMGVRKIVPMLLLTLGTLIVIEIFFVMILDLPLPRGPFGDD